MKQKEISKLYDQVVRYQRNKMIKEMYPYNPENNEELRELVRKVFQEGITKNP